jgi:hypothetical protein
MAMARPPEIPQAARVGRHRRRPPDESFPRFVQRRMFRSLWTVLVLLLAGLTVVIVQYLRVSG